MNVNEESQNLLTINTHRGLYRFSHLPYEITLASSVFQKVMDQIISGLERVQCYLDDNLVKGKDYDAHLCNLDKTVGRLE